MNGWPPTPADLLTIWENGRNGAVQRWTELEGQIQATRWTRFGTARERLQPYWHERVGIPRGRWITEAKVDPESHDRYGFDGQDRMITCSRRSGGFSELALWIWEEDRALGYFLDQANELYRAEYLVVDTNSKPLAHVEFDPVRTKEWRAERYTYDRHGHLGTIVQTSGVAAASGAGWSTSSTNEMRCVHDGAGRLVLITGKGMGGGSYEIYRDRRSTIDVDRALTAIAPKLAAAILSDPIVAAGRSAAVAVLFHSGQFSLPPTVLVRAAQTGEEVPAAELPPPEWPAEETREVAFPAELAAECAVLEQELVRQDRADEVRAVLDRATVELRARLARAHVVVYAA